jgi:flagellar protein FliT
MTAVQRCYDLTNDLLQVVQSLNEENRDDVISQIEELLEKRQVILEQIKPPFSNEEKQIGQELVKMNRALDTKLSLIRNDIKRDMNGLNKKKVSAKKYTNPYESVNFDGMFYDKRK